MPAEGLEGKGHDAPGCLPIRVASPLVPLGFFVHRAVVERCCCQPRLVPRHSVAYGDVEERPRTLCAAHFKVEPSFFANHCQVAAAGATRPCSRSGRDALGLAGVAAPAVPVPARDVHLPVHVVATLHVDLFPAALHSTAACLQPTTQRAVVRVVVVEGLATSLPSSVTSAAFVVASDSGFSRCLAKESAGCAGVLRVVQAFARHGR